MPFTPISDGLKVEELFTFEGGPDAALVWGVRMPDGEVLDSTILTAINNFFEDFWTHSSTGGSPIDALSNKVKLVERIITDVRTATGMQGSFASTLQGSQTNDPLPTGTALVTKLASDNRGRSFRGRKYFPGLSEANNDANAQPSAVVQAVFQAAIDNLITDLSAYAVGWSLAVLSRKLGIAEPVARGVVRGTWHYQRRRAR
jgi:hypothetical protein